MENSQKEKWMDDSDRIFTAITTSQIDTLEEAKTVVTQMYVPDTNFDRAGISHALKRLEIHYESSTEGKLKKLKEHFKSL